VRASKSKMKQVKVLLSECTFENEPDLLRSTLKAGLIARASAIYRVSEIGVYKSGRGRRCSKLGELLRLLLDYMVVPPYLKKEVFKQKRELKHVGLLPPLQIQPHLVSETPMRGEVRGALVAEVSGSRAVLDVGLSGPVIADLPEGVSVRKGSIIYVRVKSSKPLRVEVLTEECSKDVGSTYCGYTTRVIDSLEGYLKEARKTAYVIGTSRWGKPVWENIEVLSEKMARAEGVVLVFGEPYRGIYDIAKDLKFDIESVLDDVFNFVPEQATKTVRVEEALPVVLQTIRLVETWRT